MTELPKVEIEHDGGDHIWYVPSGPEPMPACLTVKDAARDMPDIIGDDRERAMVVALLRLSLRAMGADPALPPDQPATAPPGRETERVDGLVRTLRDQLRAKDELISRLVNKLGNGGA